MRKLAFAVALASTALATPAVARDHSFYAGLEGGAMWIEDADFDYADSNGLTITSGVTVINNGGYDIDAIAGYDFGMLRLEGELGYKHAGVNEVRLDSRLSGAGPLSNFDANGSSHALSLMINMLLDFGNEDGLSGYVGPGIGIADVHMSPEADTPNGIVGFSDSHTNLAWQGIAGLRYAVSPNIDVGLKYRFFNATNLRFGGHSADGLTDFDLKGRWRSHSIMASVIYNFWSPPPRRLRHLRRLRRLRRRRRARMDR